MHGKCLSPLNCSCDAGWTGSYCERPKCDVSVCDTSKGGICMAPNQVRLQYHVDLLKITTAQTSSKLKYLNMRSNGQNI